MFFFVDNGGDAICILDYLVERKNFYPIAIHTANPVGRANMEREIQRAIEDGINTSAEAKKANLNMLYEQYMSILQIEDSTRAN